MDQGNNNDETFTRRKALAAGIGGAAALAAIPALSGSLAKPDAADDDARAKGRAGRMPVVFMPHGGGPWPFVDIGMPRGEVDELAAYLRSVRALPKTPPRALLVVSAHWEERVPTVMTSARPPMFYDYYGFPKASYELQWPAPGEPRLAARVRTLLEGAGFETAADDERGFDHGTFVPLMLTYPDADVPTVQLSLKQGLDPEEHLAMGRALAPLRDEGVLLVGSGMTFHNMRAFRDPRGGPWSETFDAWLRESATAEPPARDRLLSTWAEAPAARLAHPREEHLLPLMVIAGAAGEDRGVVAYNGSMMGARLSAYHYG